MTEVSYSVGNVTDLGLRHLAVFQELKSLNLAGTNVTGAGLKELKQLETLDLRSTQFSDANISELASLKHLQMVDLTFTKTTEAGLNKLVRLKEEQGLIQTLIVPFDPPIVSNLTSGTLQSGLIKWKAASQE